MRRPRPLSVFSWPRTYKPSRRRQGHSASGRRKNDAGVTLEDVPASRRRGESRKTDANRIRRMRLDTRLSAALAGLALLAATSAQAWGTRGHEWISGLAVERLPPELPAF